MPIDPISPRWQYVTTFVPSKVIDIQLLTIEEAKEYEYLWATARSMFIALDDDTIARIVSLATNVCGNCHASARPCACTWDE